MNPEINLNVVDDLLRITTPIWLAVVITLVFIFIAYGIKNKAEKLSSSESNKEEKL